MRTKLILGAALSLLAVIPASAIKVHKVTSQGQADVKVYVTDSAGQADCIIYVETSKGLAGGNANWYYEDSAGLAEVKVYFTDSEGLADKRSISPPVKGWLSATWIGRVTRSNDGCERTCKKRAR